MSKRRSLAAELCIDAILTALTLAATMFINIRLPISINGGLIHLGNVPLVIAAIVFGARRGALAGAFGMGLFDLLSGWAVWAPGTFIIRGIMGLTIGKIAGFRSGKNVGINVLAVTAGGAVMVAGYYVYEALLYGNWAAPVTSVPGNLVQLVTAYAIGIPASLALKHVKLGKRIG
ncbi:MAG: ECF transporter S component [Oscillospiraceae bacterium]|jgi:uncharacterized membrane protein|nr:ECF transporter S component [Oscillospiraceae bacterium]